MTDRTLYYVTLTGGMALIFIIGFYPAWIVKSLTGIILGVISTIIGAIAREGFYRFNDLKSYGKGKIRTRKGLFVDKKTKRYALIGDFITGILILIFFSAFIEGRLYIYLFNIIYGIIKNLQFMAQILFLIGMITGLFMWVNNQ